MTQTIDYYNQHAEGFFADTVGVEMGTLHARFLAHLPQGALILDAGCGSGRDSKAFLEKGYRVSAFDASEELAHRAGQLIGQTVAVRTFLEIDEVACYDGIWASASMLHVGESHLPDAFSRLWSSLKSDGVLYAGFKLGHQERWSNGRHFTDATEERLRGWVQGLVDVADIDCWITVDQRPQRDEKWLNAIIRNDFLSPDCLITGDKGVGRQSNCFDAFRLN